MGKYTYCGKCGNSKIGDAIYQCKNCDKIFCESCSVAGSLPFLDACPHCKNVGSKYLGSIEGKSHKNKYRSYTNSTASDSDFTNTSLGKDPLYVRIIVGFIIGFVAGAFLSIILSPWTSYSPDSGGSWQSFKATFIGISLVFGILGALLGAIIE